MLLLSFSDFLIQQDGSGRVLKVKVEKKDKFVSSSLNPVILLALFITFFPSVMLS